VDQCTETVKELLSCACRQEFCPILDNLEKMLRCSRDEQAL
jgi:hypothetical protein